jgi:hypothetical protein
MSYRRHIKGALAVLTTASWPVATASAATQQITTITGELTGILMGAVPLAFVLSIALLAIYLRAVKRSMRRQSGVPQPPAPEKVPATPTVATPPVVSLTSTDVTPSDQLSVSATRLCATAKTGLWRVAAVYAVAGLLTAATLTAFYLIANEIPFRPLQAAFIALSTAWPVVLTVGLVALTSWRGWAVALGLYALALAAVVAPSLNASFTPAKAALAWVIQNGPATAMALVFLARPIRSVGPVVMAFTFAAVSGISIAVNLVGANDARVSTAVSLGTKLGLDGHQTFLAVMLTGMVVFAIVGWLFLHWLGWLYRTRRISDQSLMIDSLWLIFILHTAIDMAFTGVKWFAAALSVFVLYKILVAIGFTLTRPAADANAPQLLLLRVFSLGKRSERLFDVFAKSWRHVGSMRLIAGPDLATTTIEPHEFLDFAAGHLARRFIDGAATLERHLSESQPQRDFDGRYRVTDFFCHDDTWKMVLRRLAKTSDAVMMDLRGFTRMNKGCVFEIHALLDDVALSRIVFIVDETTDAKFLNETVAESWATLAPTSPNRTVSVATERVFRYTGAGSNRGLMRAVASAARG